MAENLNTGATMNVIEFDDNGRIQLVTYNPIEILRRWFSRAARPCVVCGVPTKYTLVNSYTGSHDHVHHPDDPDSIGCKYVWRYWRDSIGKITREEWLHRNFEDIQNGYIDPRDYDDEFFIDERDSYHDYRSYIASKEWETKSYYTKQAAGWQCEKCGIGGNKKTFTGRHSNGNSDIEAQTILVREMGCRIVSVETIGGGFVIVGERPYEAHSARKK